MDPLPEEPVKVLPGSGAYLQQLEEQRALKVNELLLSSYIELSNVIRTRSASTSKC